MKRIIALVLSITMVGSIVSGCAKKEISEYKISDTELNLDFEFDVDPETFNLSVESSGVKETVSEPLDNMKFSNLKKSKDNISWSYDEKNIDVNIKKKEEYLDVSIKSNKNDDENSFLWPSINGEKYMLPLNEGKYISNDDDVWKEYFKEQELKVIEAFSMQFFAVDKKEYSLLYVIKNPYNNTIKFDTENNIKFGFEHQYPSINENKEYGFRIYLTKKNPVDVAKTYRNYIVEKGEFKTLEEKSRENKNIEKLYGAPHVYFWDKSIISEENIKWSSLKNNIPNSLKNWIQELLRTKVEDGEELALAFDDLENLGYVDKYTKNRVLKAFSEVLKLKEFYNDKVFNSIDSESKKIISKGIKNLNEVEIIDLNKRLLKSELGSNVDDVDKWANMNTVDVLNDMKNSGINNMWIGFDDWQNGFNKPELVETANKLGYLIGTYDSYHSIHKPGEEKWITAKFSDTSLYDNATVTNKDGKKIGGFQGTGRKLNPTLAMPSVRERVSQILDTGLKFNSWFLDTDGTGEVFDDYSSEHITTEEQDIKARIERMDYLKNEKNMVVGTEGGNDFANKHIAFAHGIETPSFSWMDSDMSKNKESEYYVGRYYSSNNGVPEMFSKEIPLKDKYKKLFLDTKYTIPLYKLVYNDSVITTHWWGWGTLKIKDEVENRMLYEILYNVPPLYHIDRYEYEKNKDIIINHTKIWSEFSKKAINKEMTNYKVLSDDGLIQMTEYGNDLKVIANFSNNEVEAEGQKISPKSLIIIDKDKTVRYTP